MSETKKKRIEKQRKGKGATGGEIHTDHHRPLHLSDIRHLDHIQSPCNSSPEELDCKNHGPHA